MGVSRRTLLKAAAGTAVAAVGVAVALFAGGRGGRPAPGRVTTAPQAAAPGRESGTRQAPVADSRAEARAADPIWQFVDAHRAEVRPAEPFRLFPEGACPDVARGRVQLARATRSCFLFGRSGRVETQVALQPDTRMVFGVAAVFPEGGRPDATAVFELRAETRKGTTSLRRIAWDRRSTGGGLWEMVDERLGAFVGENVRLRFDVTIRGRGAEPLQAPRVFVSEPRLMRPGGDGRPNVVLCILDAVRRDRLSLYGYGRKTSPFLDELARESVVFDDAYSQSNWTKPSVVSMLSGLYPSQHGGGTMFERLDDAVVLLPEMLRDAGYNTAGISAGLVVASPAFNCDQGFDTFVDQEAAWDALLGAFRTWVATEAQEPFFLLVHLRDAHEPYSPVPGQTEELEAAYSGPLKELTPLTAKALRSLDLTPRDVKFVNARYDASVLVEDQAVSRLVQGLRDRGLWDNTLLIVTADHGEELHDHGDWGHGQDLRPEKLAVPLLVRLPGGAHGGLRVSGLAGGIDIVPTVLAAVGLPAPSYLVGVDLLQEGTTTGRIGRECHFAEYHGNMKRDCEHLGVVDGRYEYVLARDAGGRVREFLFDLSADPLGLRNVASELPEVRTRLAGLIAARYGFAGYTIAVNGGGRPAAFSGTVRSEARIVQAEGVRTEEGDSFEAAPDGKSLRFALNVAGDDDVLRFQTEPANAAVSIELMLDGAAAPAELVHLGPLAARCEVLPLAIPAQRCAVDADLSEARKYGAGKELGVYIWRVGTPHTGAGDANPDEETLRALKNLGYL